MIDMAAILVSTVLCLVVVFRAIRLDGQIPWFDTVHHRQEDEARTDAP